MFFLRKSFSLYRMETRILRGSGMADERIPEISPVQCLQLFHTYAGSTGGFLKRTGALSFTPGFHGEKKRLFPGAMSATRFKALPTHGSYFQIYSYKEISDKPDTEFAKNLVAQHGVAAIPVSAFYQSGKDDHVVRFCFAKKKETIDVAVEKLMKA